MDWFERKEPRLKQRYKWRESATILVVQKLIQTETLGWLHRGCAVIVGIHSAKKTKEVSQIDVKTRPNW